jgi:uroporphyrinogen decarboxylase
LRGAAFDKYSLEPIKKIITALKAVYPNTPVIAFPREAKQRYIDFHQATGTDCVAIDNSVDAKWAAENLQVAGCVQGNLAPSHMVTGGQNLVDDTRRIVDTFSGGAHIFNLGHGITPDADPANVEAMVKAVRG